LIPERAPAWKERCFRFVFAGMNGQLTHLVATERIADLHRAAARHRLAVSARERWGREASPTTPIESLVLADGTSLTIRPVQAVAADRERLRGLFARLSSESRYRRYLTPKPDLSAAEIAYLTDVDHVQHEAFAAVDDSDGSFVAVARYVREAGQPCIADIAIEVADELQNMGIGTRLATRTVQVARANGFGLLRATALRENAPARALLRRLQFRPLRSRGREIELVLELLTPEACVECP
jgi:GNAT superfamily N-acetyltransferase